MIVPTGLRAEVEAAALAALAREGAAFTRAPLVASFEGRGAHRSTIYKWIDCCLAGDGADASGATAERIGTLIADLRGRAAGLPDAISRDALALRLVQIIGTAVALVHDARGPGGRFAKPALALQALELLRKTLMNAAELAALDAGAGDAMLREPIVRELAALLNPAASPETPQGAPQ